MTNISDEILTRKYLQGDEKALELLIRNYLNSVYNFVLGYVNDPRDAEDITQETFVRVWRNLKKFDSDKGNFKTWIFGIAKNAAIDFLRTNKKSLPLSEVAELIADPKPPLLELAEQQGKAQTIKIAMANLPDKYRQVVSSHYKQGFTFQQIAESLGESLNTVKSRYRRALILLRKFLSKN
jgi:RNA polymerase sigma-70 factor (ECF subfamily)